MSWYKVLALAYDCIAILLHVSVENEQLREEGNQQANQNIRQHHFYQSTQLPSGYWVCNSGQG